MPRENRVGKSRMLFSCQVQHLVKLEGDFSWQAQTFVQFWEREILRVFIQNASSRWEESGLRSGGCEMTISCSEK